MQQKIREQERGGERIGRQEYTTPEQVDERLFIVFPRPLIGLHPRGIRVFISLTHLSSNDVPNVLDAPAKTQLLI